MNSGGELGGWASAAKPPTPPMLSTMPFDCCKCGQALRARRTAPKNFRSNPLAQSASVSFRKSPRLVAPALLTRRFNCPNSAITELDHGFGGLGGREVGHDRQRLDAERADVVGDLVEVRSIPRGDGNVHALPGKTHGDGAAKSAACAGDQRDPAGKSQIHVCLHPCARVSLCEIVRVGSRLSKRIIAFHRADRSGCVINLGCIPACVFA